MNLFKPQIREGEETWSIGRVGETGLHLFWKPRLRGGGINLAMSDWQSPRTKGQTSRVLPRGGGLLKIETVRTMDTGEIGRRNPSTGEQSSGTEFKKRDAQPFSKTSRMRPGPRSEPSRTTAAPGACGMRSVEDRHMTIENVTGLREDKQIDQRSEEGPVKGGAGSEPHSMSPLKGLKCRGCSGQLSGKENVPLRPVL